MTPSQNNIDSDPKKDRSDPDAVRKAFRVPVDEADGICAVVNGISFPVVNMNPEGVSILCDNDAEFGDIRIIENCRLELPSANITGLTARVIHCTREAEKEWHIGLQWIDLSDDNSDKIVDMVSAIKDKLRNMAKK